MSFLSDFWSPGGSVRELQRRGRNQADVQPPPGESFVPHLQWPGAVPDPSLPRYTDYSPDRMALAIDRISRWWIFCNCRQLCCKCRCNCRQCVLPTMPMWGGRPAQVFAPLCGCVVDYRGGTGISGVFTRNGVTGLGCDLELV